MLFVKSFASESDSGSLNNPWYVISTPMSHRILVADRDSNIILLFNVDLIFAEIVTSTPSPARLSNDFGTGLFLCGEFQKPIVRVYSVVGMD